MFATLGNRKLKDRIFVKYHQLEIVYWTTRINPAELHLFQSHELFMIMVEKGGVTMKAWLKM